MHGDRRPATPKLPSFYRELQGYAVASDAMTAFTNRTSRSSLSRRAGVLAAFYARKIARTALFWPRDALARGDGEVRPPRRLDFVGPGAFERTGREFLRLLVELGELRPDGHVLDIGSGVGRMALPLTDHLDPHSRYEGFDIVREGVRWCQRNISPRWPNFQFAFVDIHNPRYNPWGRQSADAFDFPYNDDAFDFAFATSVFTHMQPEAIKRYLNETARVLRPGGRLLATYFLLTEEVREQLKKNSGEQSFRYPGPRSLSISNLTPESGIAFDQEMIVSIIEASGLLVEKVEPGFWPGWDTQGRWAYQDIILARRPD